MKHVKKGWSSAISPGAYATCVGSRHACAQPAHKTLLCHFGLTWNRHKLEKKCFLNDLIFPPFSGQGVIWNQSQNMMLKQSINYANITMSEYTSLKTTSGRASNETTAELLYVPTHNSALWEQAGLQTQQPSCQKHKVQAVTALCTSPAAGRQATNLPDHSSFFCSYQAPLFPDHSLLKLYIQPHRARTAGMPSRKQPAALSCYLKRPQEGHPKSRTGSSAAPSYYRENHCFHCLSLTKSQTPGLNPTSLIWHSTSTLKAF